MAECRLEGQTGVLPLLHSTQCWWGGDGPGRVTWLGGSPGIPSRSQKPVFGLTSMPHLPPQWVWDLSGPFPQGSRQLPAQPQKCV